MQVIVLIGGNEGDREQLILEACSRIESRIGKIVSKSMLYESEPWGFETDRFFLNRALLLETSLSASEVLTEALYIESVLGRVRNKKGYASRTMDIDILFYENLCVDLPDLMIPHPKMQERRFVLLPLAEIVPDWMHPALGKTIKTLLDECRDTGNVLVFSKG